MDSSYNACARAYKLRLAAFDTLLLVLFFHEAFKIKQPSLCSKYKQPPRTTHHNYPPAIKTRLCSACSYGILNGRQISCGCGATCCRTRSHTPSVPFCVGVCLCVCVCILVSFYLRCGYASKGFERVFNAKQLEMFRHGTSVSLAVAVAVAVHNFLFSFWVFARCFYRHRSVI